MQLNVLQSIKPSVQVGVSVARMDDASDNLKNGQKIPAQITTERLVLRPYQFTDVTEMHAYLQDADMGRYLEGSGALLTRETVQAIIAGHILVDQNQRHVWAVTLNDLPVGAITLNFLKAHRVAEIGYHIKKALWYKGYASEAAKAVVDAAFACCPDLQRVQAGIHPDNIGSISVVKKLGMKHEGTLRAFAFIRGHAADEAVYAVLRNEYKDVPDAQR